MGIRPSEYIAMDSQEKAFIIACIDLKLENDKKQAKKLGKK